jgi:hypothetical protein
MAEQDAAPSEEAALATDIQEILASCKARILHTLEVFPFLSSSMIHMGIGTNTPTALWRPILRRLIDDGIVQKTERSFRAPNGRMQPYTIYHLPASIYRYGPKPE